MAIQVNINKPNQRGPGFLTFPAAYCVIQAVEYHKDKGVAITYLVVYDKQGGTQIDYMQYQFTPSVLPGASDFVTQGYVDLMSRPEFSNAVAC